MKIVTLSISYHEHLYLRKPSLLFSNIVGSLYFWRIRFSRLFWVKHYTGSKELVVSALGLSGKESFLPDLSFTDQFQSHTG